MWQKIQQWWSEQVDEWRYIEYMTRTPRRIGEISMLIAVLSKRLDFFSDWLIGLGSVIAVICAIYIRMIVVYAHKRPEDWEHF